MCGGCDNTSKCCSISYNIQLWCLMDVMLMSITAISAIWVLSCLIIPEQKKISETVTSIIRISKKLNLYQGQSSCLSTVHFWNFHKPHRAGCGIRTWIWPKNWEVLVREKVAMDNSKPLKFCSIKPLLKVPWLDQHRSLRSARGRTFCSSPLLSPWQPNSVRLHVFILWLIIFIFHILSS